MQSQTTADNFTVAFQGEPGAYSQAAVYSYFGKQSMGKAVPLPTLQRVFAELATGRQDFAVVPIENSLAGSVGETLDLLIERPVRIVGEISIQIEHALMVHRDSSVERVAKVISHPQALSQCREFLEREGTDWQQIAVYDTAGAAKMINEQNLMDTAAIASELACEIYGLKLLERNIEDDHSNATRFIVVEPMGNQSGSSAKPRPPSLASGPTGEDKTSIVFSTKHEPGALVRALSALSLRGINLDKIESRPIKTKPWEYYFFVDFEGHEAEARCARAVMDLKQQTLELKVLGSYRRGI